MDESNLCVALVPTYMPAFPIDPSVGVEGDADVDGDEQDASTECDDDYNTGYHVEQVAGGRIIVSANGEEPAGTDNISVTR